MRCLLLPLALVAGQDTPGVLAPLDLQAAPVHERLLVELLNGGEATDLNKTVPGKRQNLSLRLHAVGHTGTCVPGTEWVCSYRYVLAVSEYGEMPAQAAYDLGELGEIVPLRWLEAGGGDRSILEVEVRNYPEHAAKANVRLQIQRRRYRLEISLQLEPAEGKPSSELGFVLVITPAK